MNARRLDALPIAPWSADVRIWRHADGEVGASIPHTVIWHSPTGWEFGYGGSGPADLALNILNAFVPPGRDVDWEDEHDDPDRDDAPVECYQGMCSKFAVKHHQAFKSAFIAPLAGRGGTLLARTIREWIAARRSLGLRSNSPTTEEYRDE